MAEKKQRKKLTVEEKAANKKAALEKAKEIDERREKVMNLYLSGASIRTIAKHLSSGGVEVSKTTVERDINFLLDKNTGITEQEANRLRNLQMRRINALILANWSEALKGDNKKAYLVRTLMSDLTELGGAKAPVKFEHDHKFNPKELSDEELQSIADSSGKS